MKIKPAEMGEAISLGISTLLVILLLGYLLVALFHRSDSPYLQIKPSVQDAVNLQNDGYVLPIIVENKGERTAASVTVIVKLPDGEREIEVEYLPRGSTRYIYLNVDQPYNKNQVSAKTSHYKLD